MLSEGLRAGDLRERGFLPPGGRAAFPVRIASGECALIVALGSANLIDLDAALYTGEGAVLVEDDGASARPSLTLCASGQPLAGYLTLHAYQGAGAFVAAQYTRPVPPATTSTPRHYALSALGQLASPARLGLRRRRTGVGLPSAMPPGPARVNVARRLHTLAAYAARGLVRMTWAGDAHCVSSPCLGVEPPSGRGRLQYAQHAAALTWASWRAGQARFGRRLVASQRPRGQPALGWRPAPAPQPGRSQARGHWHS